LKKKKDKGEKPWCSGYGRWFMTKRLCVQTPAHYTWDKCKPFASYYIKEKLKIKVAKWGTPKQILHGKIERKDMVD
jgi:hypothetical protein